MFGGDEVLKTGSEWTDNIACVPYTGATYYELQSSYEVYDKNVTPAHPNGNLIRKGSAVNRLNPLSILELKESQMKRGCEYKLKLTVMPTYLYVLSEPDLDNPSVVF